MKMAIQIQCNPHQNSNEILHRYSNINPKIHIEVQKILNSQSDSEKKRTMQEVSQHLISNYITEP
jgi:hypothetical protein